MNRYGSNFVSFRRWASIFGGLLLLVFGGFYVLSVSAKMKAVENLVPLDYRNSGSTWQPAAQTANTVAVNGRIMHSNVSVGGAVVNLSGTINAAATTDADGNYQFSGLPAGGNYTVSPSFVRHYFTPANRSFNNLTSNQTADFEVSGVCFAGNCVKNGKIAFTRNDDIFTMNPNGTNQTNITNNAAADGEANYSPDGSKIAFSTNRDGNAEIYQMNADGSSPVRLTNNPAGDASPYYSPDGASIVFVSNRDGNNEIYKMNADGSNQMRLTNDPATDFAPAFSPDGQKIIFITSRQSLPNFYKLFTMNADGSNQQELSNVHGFYKRPSYSPDGTKIIFVYGGDITQQRIWTMNADGTNRMVFPANSHSPSYSPDGTKVVLTCCLTDTFNPYRIFSANSDGSSQQILTPLTVGVGSSDFPDWQPLIVPRPAPFDFDGDGRSDVSVFRPSNGNWYQLRSTAGFSAVQWGFSTDLLVPADYDGDLKTDVAVWRPAPGDESRFYILNSSSNTVRTELFALAGDIPLAGDWDGDGRADLTVYRNGASGGQSYFFYRPSSQPGTNFITVPWGTTGDKPVAGDYDDDGRTDAAVFRNGNWYIRQNSNGQTSAVNFGLADDKLVPADYDGDGKTDVAVYRGGNWYLLRSAQGFTAIQFGISNDIPAPADYDGDGRTDTAVFRNGTWWILKSQSSTVEGVSFGSGGDAPVPSAFVR